MYRLRLRAQTLIGGYALCSLSNKVRCEASLVSVPKHPIGIAKLTNSEGDSKQVLISYVTDIEGNLDYWTRFKSISRVLSEDANGKVIMNDGTYLVFGGDICDRGPGDIRITEELLDLKARYPSQVYFILGNRDVNKLRFSVEAHDKLLGVKVDPYWVRGKGNNGDMKETAPERVKKVKELIC